MPQQCVYVMPEFKLKTIKNYHIIRSFNKKEYLKLLKRSIILAELVASFLHIRLILMVWIKKLQECHVAMLLEEMVLRNLLGV